MLSLDKIIYMTKTYLFWDIWNHRSMDGWKCKYTISSKKFSKNYSTC